MRMWEILATAARSLRTNRLRTILSILGIVIGVASVITLIAVGTGTQNQVTERISALGTNIINISPAFGVGRGGRQSSSGENIFTLDLGEKILAFAPSVKRITPVQQMNGSLVLADQNLRVTLMGITPEYADIMNYKVHSGRFIRALDVDEEAFVAVLGWGVAQDLFGPVDPVGQRVVLSAGGRRFPLLVVGVMEERGQVGFMNFDDLVYMPITTLLHRVTGGRTVSSYIAEAYSAAEVNDAVGQISYFLTRRTGNSTGFRVTSQLTLLEALTETIGTFTVMLAAIGGISLLVGGIGIMNIMLVSVTERTREIGLRKAVGALRRDLLMQFLAEAVLLSVAGGMIGVALGWLGSMAVTRFGGIRADVSFSSVLLALGFSMTVGLVFGVYPASRAARLDPVVALRHE